MLLCVNMGEAAAGTDTPLSWGVYCSPMSHGDTALGKVFPCTHLHSACLSPACLCACFNLIKVRKSSDPFVLFFQHD